MTVKYIMYCTAIPEKSQIHELKGNLPLNDILFFCRPIGTILCKNSKKA